MFGILSQGKTAHSKATPTSPRNDEEDEEDLIVLQGRRGGRKEKKLERKCARCRGSSFAASQIRTNCTA